MLVNTKTKINNINMTANKSDKTFDLNILKEGKVKPSLKDLFKYFTVNIPEVLIGKADAKAIQASKKEIDKKDYLLLDELILKMKSN